jgi:type VI secretion system protein ImpM
MPGATLVNMTNIASSLKFGFFGKIPSAGDFVSRDIPHHHLRQIDDWFSEGMLSLSIEQQTCLDAYLTAPVWNFVVFPGVWGDKFFYGALMPSVDSVGRYFPLITIVQGMPLSNVDSVLVSYLPSLANGLPILLEGNLQPDDIGDFFAEHVRPEVSVSDILAALDVVKLDVNKSYWWHSAHELSSQTSIVHHGSPNQKLFKQLFFDFQSPLP